jgi:membrane protein implicated in regulation of membrane protease activity
MDQLIEAWTGVGAWRWLAIAALLFAIEMATGTAYLLWMSAAAAITAVAVAIIGEFNFAVELLLFGLFAMASTFIGKRFFAPRMVISDQPDLNQPERRHIGARAVAVTVFSGGEGRAKMGDSVWSAVMLDGANPAIGAGLEVVRVDGTVLHVKSAD